MGRMKDAIVETGTPDALELFGAVTAAVRNGLFGSEMAADDSATDVVVDALVARGMPAAMFGGDTQERRLAFAVAKGLRDALLSFGAIRCAATAFTQEAACDQDPHSERGHRSGQHLTPVASSLRSPAPLGSAGS